MCGCVLFYYRRCALFNTSDAGWELTAPGVCYALVLRVEFCFLGAISNDSVSERSWLLSLLMPLPTFAACLFPGLACAATCAWRSA